ncbi:MAG: hypothetical protein GC181_15470 [Bacteroidetes bacterium]|nr:hypothetical protein [Bacteroidota bacterium]
MFNPFLSLRIGFDRILISPTVGVKLSRLSVQLGYFRFFWHDEFSTSVEYLIPGYKLVHGDIAGVHSIQLTSWNSGNGGFSPYLFVLQFGNLYFKSAETKSRFFRWGILNIPYYSRDKGLTVGKFFPAISVGYVFHAFPIYKRDLQ